MIMKGAKGTVGILGTLDTKAVELGYLKKRCSDLGLRTLVIDLSLGETEDISDCAADVSRQEVLSAAGLRKEDFEGKTIGEAIRMMTIAAEKTTAHMYADGKFSGLLGIGGGRGSHLCASAMRAAPFGVPKILVSTVAGRTSGPFVDTSDLIIVPSVSDLVGINRITRTVLSNAAAAMYGMVSARRDVTPDAPLVAISALGVTTQGAMKCLALLRAQGLEAAIFHCNGLGGRVMEKQIRDGRVSAVLDLTTTELADELLGGMGSAGEDRLEAAGRMGIPQVVVPGALDMLLFHSADRIPSTYATRLRYEHTPTAILVRTSAEENFALGRMVGDKLLKAKGSVSVLIPTHGVSDYDKPGARFYLPEAVAAFEKGLREVASDKLSIESLPLHINDDDFARRAVSVLIELINAAHVGRSL